MIIEPVQVREVDGGVERRAVVRWGGRQVDLSLTAPDAVADRSDDLSCYLAAALPVAMRHHEDLVVAGPVSPTLLAQVERIQAVYAAWDPTMTPVDVRADDAALGPAAADRVAGVCFSRGVDSVFAAARDAAGERRFGCLVFVDGVEPRHSGTVRGEEARRAALLGDRLGLPLLVPRTDVRRFTDEAGLDWEDALAAGLSFVGHGLAGGLSTLVIPSSDSYESVEPCGSSPLLDPLFSTERVAIEHDDLTHTRLRKLRWLGAHRPDLLDELKVCYAEDRPDNCGRCGKCLYTMACLQVADATALATGFPPALDLDAVRAMRLPHLKSRIDWAELATAIEPGSRHDDLRRAVLEVLANCRLVEPDRDTPVGRTWTSTQWMRNHRLNETLSLVIEGRPYPPGERSADRAPSDPPPAEPPAGVRRRSSSLVDRAIPVARRAGARAQAGGRRLGTAARRAPLPPSVRAPLAGLVRARPIRTLWSGVNRSETPGAGSSAAPSDPGAASIDEPTPGVRPSPLLGHIDLPHDGEAAVDGLLPIQGWAAPATGIDRVEVVVTDDGQERTEVVRPFCIPREDLVAPLGDATALLGGFEHLLDVGPVEPERDVHIRLEAVRGDERECFGFRIVRSRPGDAELAARLAETATQAEEDGRWLATLEARAALRATDWAPGDGLSLLVVTHHLGLGGAQLWLQEILRRLLRRPDVSCTVAAPTDGPLRRELEAAGARVHLLGAFPATGGAYESQVADLVALAAADDVNVVLANTLGAFVGVDVALRGGVPSVLAVHEHLPLAAYWRAAFGGADVDPHVKGRASIALHDASVVTFVADATRELHLPQLRADRAVRIDYDIDPPDATVTGSPDDRDRRRAALGVAADDVVVLCVATVERRKAQSNLLLAFQRVLGDHPHARLVVIGADPLPYSVACASLVDALGLADRVRWLDLTADVDAWYAAADAFVLPSDLESLPRVLLEAMAHRLPVLATEVGGVGELVTDGVTGLTCPPRDIGALARGLDRLLSLSVDEREAFASAAAARRAGRGGLDGYAATYERLLRALVDDPASSPAALLEP